jgi:hypothetical protein
VLDVLDQVGYDVLDDLRSLVGRSGL